MQKNIRELLESNWTSWWALLLEMVEDSYKAVSQNNNCDVIPDYKGRAKIKRDVLEAAGIFKPAGSTTFNFYQHVFQSKDKPWESQQWVVIESI